MDPFQSSDVQGSKTTLDRWSAISQVIIAATSVFSLLVILFTNISALPGWIVYVPLATLVIGLAVWLFPQIGKCVRWGRKRKLARSKFSTLILLAEEFQHLSSPQQADTITSALANVQTPEGNLQNTGFSQLCAWIISNLIQRLRVSPRDFGSLRLGTQELHALVHSYHRLYFFDTIDKVRRLPSGSVPIESVRTIEVAREAYTTYLDNFQAFCKEINESLSTKVFDFYFQKAKPVFPGMGETERKE